LKFIEQLFASPSLIDFQTPEDEERFPEELTRRAEKKRAPPTRSPMTLKSLA